VTIQPTHQIAKEVRHIVTGIVSPFGPPIEDRPPVMSMAEYEKRRDSKRQAKIGRRLERRKTKEEEEVKERERMEERERERERKRRAKKVERGKREEAEKAEAEVVVSDSVVAKSVEGEQVQVGDQVEVSDSVEAKSIEGEQVQAGEQVERGIGEADATEGHNTDNATKGKGIGSLLSWLGWKK
jgi:small subunit ribosomal protein S17